MSRYEILKQICQLMWPNFRPSSLNLVTFGHANMFIKVERPYLEAPCVGDCHMGAARSSLTNNPIARNDCPLKLLVVSRASSSLLFLMGVHSSLLQDILASVSHACPGLSKEI